MTMKGRIGRIMKKQRVKFKDLSKRDKIFRIVNLVLMAAIVAVSVGLGIYYGLTGDKYNRLAACITMAVLAVVPYLVELIFRTRLSNILFFGLEIYLVFAGIVGSLLRVYVTLFWYDMFVHTLMGYLVAMLGIFIISKLGDYSKLSPWLIAVFCLLFSLSIELIWELSEWFSDLFVGQTAQGDKIPGYGAPLVTDTMEDILCNFSGAILFFLHFVISKATHKSLGIHAMERELAGVGKIDTQKMNTFKKENQDSQADVSSLELNEKANSQASLSNKIDEEALVSVQTEEILESVAVANADEEKLDESRILKRQTKGRKHTKHNN